MKPKMFPLLAFVALCGVMLVSNSCGSGPANCPVCGTQKNGQIALIDVMLVPEHNPNGEPGGPFNIFDISWTDPVNRNYFVSDRIGLDVPVFNTVSNIALFAVGGQNSVAEAGNNTSNCWLDTGHRAKLFLHSPPHRVISPASDARRTASAFPASLVPTATSADSWVVNAALPVPIT